MHAFILNWLVLVALTLLGPLALAQAGRTSGRIDPTDPSAAVPSVAYRSSFSGYRQRGDEPVAPWKQTNDLVGRIGGWRVYAREARQPDLAPTAPSKNPSTADPPPTASPAKPDGHTMQHGDQK